MDRSALSKKREKIKDGANNLKKQSRMTAFALQQTEEGHNGNGQNIDRKYSTMTGGSDNSSSSDDSVQDSEDDETSFRKSGSFDIQQRKTFKWETQNALGLFPVSNVACSVNRSTTAEEADELYVGSWVTQVSLAHPDGQAIRHFRAKQDALLTLRRQRARTLMNATKDRQKDVDKKGVYIVLFSLSLSLLSHDILVTFLPSSFFLLPSSFLLLPSSFFLFLKRMRRN
jgi:hypothetical protein